MFKCKECDLLVDWKDFNLQFGVCKWCAFKHTKTFKDKKFLIDFDNFCKGVSVKNGFQN